MFRPPPQRRCRHQAGAQRGAEHALWDLKERLSHIEYEKAKDVAAFANHLGGTILIGAQEDRSSQVLTYNPLTSKEADDSEKAIAQAINNRCRPTPLINFERISGLSRSTTVRASRDFS
ncbi:MAG: ATP-binding protein [Myxococcales bacterium]|nr:ATP-binding protein [Myxococcales bacterium]